MWTVNLWCSHPDNENDDCASGGDFESKEDALKVYRDLSKGFSPAVLASMGAHYFVELDGIDRHEVREVGKASKSDDSWEKEWAREQANEAGMLHGVEAYNDHMGY